MPIILFLLLFFVNFCHASHSVMFKEADPWVYKQIQQNYSTDARYLLPSQRFLEIEQVKNLRFKGRYGLHQVHLYLHPQVLLSDLNFKSRTPQDAIALIIQCLFPSPDGVLLIANQAYSDPLSRISSASIGALLRDLETYKQQDHTDINTQKGFVINFISYILSQDKTEINQKYERLSKHLPEFRAHSFKLNFITKLYKVLTDEPEIAEEYCEEVGETFTIDDPNWIHQIAKTSFLKDILSENHPPINELKHYWQFSQVYKNIKSKTSSEEEAEPYKQQIFYEENSRFYQAMVFAEALLQAFELQENAELNSLYPQKTLQRSLMAFMWLKATNVTDVIAFYANLFNSSLEEVEEAFSNFYTWEEYQAIKEALLKNPSLFQSDIVNHPETLAFMGKGFELYDSSFSPLLQYRSVPYVPKNGKSRLKGANFPDCVETSIRNFLNIVSRTATEKGYIYDGALLRASEGVTEFYRHYQTAEAIFSGEAFKVWGNLLTEFPDVVYCKPNNNPVRKFEVHSGILNSLKVLSHLLGSQPLSQWVDQARLNDEKALIEANKELTQRFQRDGYTLTVNIDDELQWNDKLRDYFGTLIFQINGQDHFKWVQEEQHSYLKYVNTHQHDWRKSFDVDLGGLSNQASLSLLPWFMKVEDLNSVKKIPAKEQLSFFWSCALEDEEVRLKVIELNIADQDPQLRELSYQLIQSIGNLNDPHPNTQLAQLIYNMSTGETRPLDKRNLERIISLAPKMMEAYINIPSNTPFGNASYPFILWAYEIGGSVVLKKSYETLISFSLMLPSLPEEKLEIVYSLLEEIRNFKNLYSFQLHGLLQEDTARRARLLEAIKSIPDVKHIYLTGNSFSYPELLNILDTFSDKNLEKVDISFNNIASNQEAIDLYKYFLAHFKDTTLRMAPVQMGDFSTLKQELQDQGLATDCLILE